MSFDAFGLRAELLRAIRDQGYTTPTPVQERAIPSILEGRDLMAAAPTGTGKTAGFTLPMLQRLMTNDPRGRRPVRALVVVPTRELAAQVMESIRVYGKHLPLRSTAIFGGVGINPQIATLRRGVDVVVATPGRLLDHVGQGTIDLGQVEICVLDEADRMLDMGFLPDVRRILAQLPERRQNLLFSATLVGEITRLADGLLDDPEYIDVTPRNMAAETVDQLVYRVDTKRKAALLSELFETEGWQQVLVFTRTKHRANRVAASLRTAGIEAVAIHGNKSQNARTRALAAFKAGRTQALIATDIASRGLDISGLPQVVNFELPFVPEDYVHRVGRTGRAGTDGLAISLVCESENAQLRAIERVLGRTIPAETIPGFEPDPTLHHEPIKQGRGGRSRPGRGSQPSSRRPGSQSQSNGSRPGSQRPRNGSSARAGATPGRRRRR
ncbi:MAG: DEAD/DEAH box helicase [Chloroflexi bacterium]|nr:DEAD/DEAH box helicase [Chloroflexota bacterium]